MYLSYRELQKKAKDLNVSARGSYLDLAARILEAETKPVKPFAQKDVECSINTDITQKRAGSGPKTGNKASNESVNKRGKTKSQVKKDNEAAAGLMACGRI